MTTVTTSVPRGWPNGFFQLTEEAKERLSDSDLLFIKQRMLSHRNRERQFALALLAVFQQQHAIVVDNVRTLSGNISPDDAMKLLPVGTLTRELRNVALAHMTRAALSAARLAVQRIEEKVLLAQRHTKQWQVVSKQLIDLPKRTTEAIRTGVNETMSMDYWENIANQSTRNRLSRKIRSGITQKKPLLDIVESIEEDQSGLFTPQRSARIARTETTMALNAGHFAVNAELSHDEDLGVVGREWVAILDNAVRPTHSAADGQVRPPNKPFNIGNSEARYPGDPLLPAGERINCRCVLIDTFDFDEAHEAGGDGDVMLDEPSELYGDPGNELVPDLSEAQPFADLDDEKTYPKSKNIERDKQIVRQWDAGEMTIDEIAAYHGISKIRTRQVLLAWGRSTSRGKKKKPKPKPKPEKEKTRNEQIVEDWDKGLTLEQLSAKYGLSVVRLRQIINAAGRSTRRGKLPGNKPPKPRPSPAPGEDAPTQWETMYEQLEKDPALEAKRLAVIEKFSGAKVARVTELELKLLQMQPKDHSLFETMQQMKNKAMKANAQRTYNYNKLTPDWKARVDEASGPYWEHKGEMRRVRESIAEAKQTMAAVPGKFHSGYVTSDKIESTNMRMVTEAIGLPKNQRGNFDVFYRGPHSVYPGGVNVSDSVRAKTKEAAEFIGSITHKDVMSDTALYTKGKKKGQVKNRITREVSVHEYKAPYRANAEPAINPHQGIHVEQNEELRTVVHELGHVVENTRVGGKKANKLLGGKHTWESRNEGRLVSRNFLDHRIEKSGKPTVNLKKEFGGGYDHTEIGNEDDFQKAYQTRFKSSSQRRLWAIYTGKDYGARATEAISMGLENLAADPLGFATNDPQYFKFVIGFLDNTLAAI